MKRYEYENAKNQRTYGGQVYHPAPTAPKVEVIINQNPASPASPYAPPPSLSNSSRRPPGYAPPPPPTYHSNTDSIYSEPMWFDRFPRRENRGMFRLCLVQTLLALVILGGGIWCYRDTSDYCPYYSAIWTSAVYLINAIVGSAASKIGSLNLYLAHLVLSMLSIMMCFVSGGLSARNWALVGTYHHPTIARDSAFCLLGEHDASRISYIFSHMDQYDFKHCLFQLKVGVAVNSVQFVIAAIEALLNGLSVFL
uniref:MARVEL domain-containing protein n=1 Tax=Acrobeloides nanus TaxID=290746 RepID=A0A914E8G4_9BILA